MKLFIAMVFCVISATSWAGDAAQLRFLGFSESGKYLAFQEYGITDGEGATFVNLYLVDVENNYILDEGIETRDTSGQTTQQVLATNLQQAKNKLKEFGIIADNVGEKMISRPFSDVGTDEKKARFAIGTPLAGLQHRTYQLTLNEKDGGVCTSAGVPISSRKFGLTLLNEATKVSKILKKDVAFPQNDDCPTRYRIQDVYIYHEEFIAVFINSLSPGYEGENMRYLVVTGTLN